MEGSNARDGSAAVQHRAGGALPSSVNGLLSSVWQLLVGGDHEPTPVESAMLFASSLRARYGAGLPRGPTAPTADSNPSGPSDTSTGIGPAFFAGAFQEAITRADTECKPLLVYLHSDLHEDAPTFVRDCLFDSDVASLVNQRFVSWGGSMQSRDGVEAANAFSVTGERGRG